MTLSDVNVVNELGVSERISSHLEDQTLLIMGFYHCKHICHFISKNLRTTLRRMKNYPKIVFLSVDEDEGPRDALLERKKVVGIERKHWAFLTSHKEDIKLLTKNLNFSFKRDPASGSIIHEIAIYKILKGKVISKINTIRPTERDLLFESDEKIIKNSFKEFCSIFDPKKSKYGFLIMKTLSITCCIFLIFTFFLLRQLVKTS